MLSTPVQRGILVVAGFVVGLGGWLAWGIEHAHGGHHAIEDLYVGHLVDGAAEVRRITVEWHGNYEVERIATDRFALRWIDRPEAEPAEFYAGSRVDTIAYLDRHGPAVFRGTPAQVDAWLEQRRTDARNFVVPGGMIALGIALVVLALMPLRLTPTHTTRRRMSTTPTMGAG
jgi:hypothetical protein